MKKIYKLFIITAVAMLFFTSESTNTSAQIQRDEMTIDNPGPWKWQDDCETKGKTCGTYPAPSLK